MSHITLGCTACGAPHSDSMATLCCTLCRSPLEVRYTNMREGSSGSQTPYWPGRQIPLPLHGTDSMVSLGEGNTACVELTRLGKLLGVTRLYAKLEHLNPTGSFKDRGAAIMTSVAREQGVTEVVEDSSGNAGASVSAYAARAGIKAHIFVPVSAPPPKVRQIILYGAQAHSIEGSREATTEAAVSYCTERGLVYASHILSPYFLEGTKTFAYEVSRELAQAHPDHIVMPVGNGSLFIGAFKGYGELRDAKHLSEIPRFHCVQARAVMPIVAAYNGDKWSPPSTPNTIAGGIAAAAPARKQEILDVLRATGGIAVAVDDEEILRWQKLLAEREGIFAEPTSAAALAGLDQLVKRGAIQNTESVLVPITGSGLKDATPG